jgi:hypothetical protein
MARSLGAEGYTISLESTASLADGAGTFKESLARYARYSPSKLDPTDQWRNSC